MSRRASLRRRSPVEWAARITLALVVALAGYVSVTHSMASALLGGDVQHAHRLAPGDARITAALSERLTGAEATAADRERADRLARAALLRDATAVEAAATLGIDTLLRGDQVASRRLFAYSQRLSRRDLRTQVWAIEDAVARGEVADALEHYDIALRTKSNAPELLFPVLASAVSDPSIRSALIGKLAGQPSWSKAFIDYIGNNDSDPQATAALYRGLQQANIPVSEAPSAALVNALILAGHPDDAWSYYTTIRRGAYRGDVRDPLFKAALDNPSLFDWTPMSAPGISTSIQPGTTRGLFDFAASSSVGGVLLQQTQMLSPGEYTLDGHSIGIDQPDESLPYWMLSCREGRELGRVIVPSSSRAEGRFTGRFVVPADCPVQVLALVARASSKIDGVVGQIDRVQLRPIK